MILLHNLNQAGGLCNGTRFIVYRIRNGYLLQVIVAGTERYALLPRITLSPTEGTFPFEWQCHQFLICHSHYQQKSGQNIAWMGVDLHDSVSMHGQLYVAASHITQPINIVSVSLFHAKHVMRFTQKFFYTTNLC